ncbi:translational machinery component [Whalleya microplaca]|nr:translational machinery component [Whalleya microplaca]
MNPSANRLMAATRSLISSLSQPITHARQWVQPFSQTVHRQETGPSRPSSLLDGLRLSSPPQPPPTRRVGAEDPTASTSDIRRILSLDVLAKARNQPTSGERLAAEAGEESVGGVGSWNPNAEPYHFHVYSHRHNSHVTVTRPDRSAIISISAGNIGFRKVKRGTYDAAYQMCAFVMDKLNQGGWHKKINALEVVLRGFGPGREAAVKILLGTEGRMLRDKIVKVSDATRLKFGGTRSPKPRRLG